MSGLPDRFQRAQKEFTHRSEPKMSIYQTGGGHINAAAVRQLFDGQPEALFIGADPAANEIGFVPADRDAPDSYVFSTDDQGQGGDIRFGTTLEVLGIDPSEYDDTQYLSLERRDSVVVADVSELVDGEGDPDSETVVEDGTTEDSDAGEPDADASEQDDAPATEDSSDEADAEPADDGPELDDSAVDDAADRDTKVRQLLDASLDVGDSVTVEASEIADRVDEDGRGVPYAFKALDEYAVEQQEHEPPTPNAWTITREADAAEAFEEAVEERTTDDAEPDEVSKDVDPGVGVRETADAIEQDTADDDLDEVNDDVLGDEDDGPSKDEVRYWCGFCGKGPFQREDQVAGHHDRNDHPGEPVPRTQDPADEQLLEDGPNVDAYGSPALRVNEWLSAHIPESRFVKIEDIAIECDLSAAEVQDVLEGGVDGYQIARDDRLLRIGPADGGGA